MSHVSSISGRTISYRLFLTPSFFMRQFRAPNTRATKYTDHPQTFTISIPNNSHSIVPNELDGVSYFLLGSSVAGTIKALEVSGLAHQVALLTERMSILNAKNDLLSKRLEIIDSGDSRQSVVAWREEIAQQLACDKKKRRRE